MVKQFLVPLAQGFWEIKLIIILPGKYIMYYILYVTNIIYIILIILYIMSYIIYNISHYYVLYHVNYLCNNNNIKISRILLLLSKELSYNILIFIYNPII